MGEFWSGTWAAMESRQITLAVKINVCTGNESSKIVDYGPIIQNCSVFSTTYKRNPLSL